MQILKHNEIDGLVDAITDGLKAELPYLLFPQKFRLIIYRLVTNYLVDRVENKIKNR